MGFIIEKNEKDVLTMKKFLIITALLAAIAAAVTYIILKSDKVKAVLAKKLGKKNEEETADPCECCEKESCDGCDLVAEPETDENGEEPEAEAEEEPAVEEAAEEEKTDAE